MRWPTADDDVCAADAGAAVDDDPQRMFFSDVPAEGGIVFPTMEAPQLSLSCLAIICTKYSRAVEPLDKLCAEEEKPIVS